MIPAKPIMVYHNNSKPYGLSYSEWTCLWWKWLISIPKDRNPAIHRSKQFCVASQYHPEVWFLAGTFGGSYTRKCKIPYGKAILVPIINYECSFADEPSIRTEKGLQLKCAAEINDIVDKSAYLDGNGINLDKCRVQSECFEVNIPSNNCLDTKSGLTTMTSDGYWLFIGPLPHGTHTLTTLGSCLAGKIRVGCNLQLIIE